MNDSTCFLTYHFGLRISIFEIYRVLYETLTASWPFNVNFTIVNFLQVSDDGLRLSTPLFRQRYTPSLAKYGVEITFFDGLELVSFLYYGNWWVSGIDFTPIPSNFFRFTWNNIRLTCSALRPWGYNVISSTFMPYSAHMLIILFKKNIIFSSVLLKFIVK